MTEVVKNFRRKHSVFALIARGFCMGSADIIPGVSGGTMAFIMGIYEELIDAIRTFASNEFWSDVLHGRIGKALKRGRWDFLLPLAGGILLAVFSLSHALEYVLTTYPILVWSFFFGLVSASVYFVALRIKKWKQSLGLLVVLGAIAGYIIVGLVPVETPNTWWFLVLSGAIAICAMILPGISGAFLLLVLGKYEQVLNAVNTRDFLTVGYVGVGAVVGLILFSRVLSWLLHRHHDSTVAFLTGLMIGSLRKVWPWKVADINVLPSLTVDGALNTDLLIGVILILIGIVVVYIIEKLAASHTDW